MLVEMAVADAYAIPFEFTPHTEDRPNDLSRYHQHPTYIELSPGQYTDDTQRAIGNCKVLLDNALDKFSAHSYAMEYLGSYRADPREGYSRGFQALLKSVDTPMDFLATVKRTAVSNGSLMGVAPLGFIKNINELKLAATIQATATHHPATAVHAQIVALSAHYFLHNETKNRLVLRDWLIRHVDWVDKTDDAYRWEYLVDQQANGGKTTIKASSISSYVVYALETFDSLTDIMRDAVRRGGDTDSAAASAVAVASCCPSIKQDIPQHLLDALEPGSKFGLDYLAGLEAQMRAKFL